MGTEAGGGAARIHILLLIHFTPQVFPENDGKPSVTLTRVGTVFGQLLVSPHETET